jgi:4-diphosphocytidyl-2-C-methyl-D-erythritol kinase
MPTRHGPLGGRGVSDPLRRLAPVVRVAPAKLNLTLAVTGRRADGFHALHSVMVPLALSDRLSLAVSAGAADTLHVAGYDPGPPEANLILRAIAAARDAVGPVGGLAPGPGPALAVRLEKRIPVAAGLAGGSSDAAAALDGALEAWGLELPDDRRSAIAASLGSDVPFFLAGSVALVEGRGELVTPLRSPAGGGPGVLLVTPPVAVPTPAVFAAFAEGRRPETLGAARATSEHLAAELARGLTSAALLDRSGILAAANDLIPATASVAPGLVPFRRALFRLLGRPVGQSGSGPSLWALYPSVVAAKEAAGIVGAAVAAGDLEAPGGSPLVVATTFTGG